MGKVGMIPAEDAATIRSAYDRDVLDRAAWSHSTRSPRLLVEYWAHEAALMAVDEGDRLLGVVTWEQVRRALQQGAAGATSR